MNDRFLITVGTANKYWKGVIDRRAFSEIMESRSRWVKMTNLQTKLAEWVNTSYIVAIMEYAEDEC